MLEHYLMLGLAAALGAIIGFERELKQRPAGLGTHMLVCLAAALIVIVGKITISSIDAAMSQGIAADPTRLIHSIIVGISFIGAGTIWQSKGKVEGLTTAASVFTTAAIGITVGIGEYLLATVTAIVIAFLTYFVNKFEERVLGT